MELRKTLKETSRKHQVAWGIVEQDYVLSWLLYGIAQTEELRGKLVFKGGTALKKIYFGDSYRFSQDLDFTALEGAPQGESLEQAITKACTHAQKELATRVTDPIITCSRYTEKSPHPNAQEAFVIRAKLPWHTSPYVRVMIEVTFNQMVVNPPHVKRVIHNYPEEYQSEMLTFTLDEIFAEKLIAMHQNAIKLHEQGWSRSRTRDYYDLWRLINSFPDQLHEQTIRETLQLKCNGNPTFTSINTFFDPLALNAVEKDWNVWLGQMVHPLPEYKQVVPELQKTLASFFKWT